MPTKRIVGPAGRLFAEPQPSADETGFRQDNTSAAYYNSPYYLAHQKQVQPIPPPRPGALPFLSLADFVPAEVMAAINGAGQISFHSVGDTGAAKVSRSQGAATAIGHEGAVADAMAAETQGLNGPAFFFHLGDIIYNFGEGQYYYDQFYEPFRAYDRPIFAIPGNHDGMVFGPDSSAPQVPTLAAFLVNFCAAAAGPSPDACGLVRSVMTQSGAYFTLDAPFVSVIGLYSNVLDGPGVLSSQRGHFSISDEQIPFLERELGRLKPDRDAGKRAVVLAVHHPPLSADARHGGSTGLLADIDAACQAAGLWPDLVLSGHAHLYQRFTRVVNGKETPYIVAGSGGFSATPPRQKAPPAGTTVDDHTLEIDPLIDFGYLTITTDAKTLSVTFRSADKSGVSQKDLVKVDLQTGKILEGRHAQGKAGGAAGGGQAGGQAGQAAGGKRKRKPRK